MARVTVEDCVVRVPNRFELVMLAAQRARNISSGAQLTIDRDNDKNPVVALREIADQMVDFDDLENALIKGLQRFPAADQPEDEDIEFTTLQAEAAPGNGEAAETLGDMLAVADDDDADAAGDVMESGDEVV